MADRKNLSERSISAATVLHTYLKAAWRYPWLFSAVLLGGIIIEVSGVIAPVYLRNFINDIAHGTPSPELMTALFTLLGFYALTQATTWIGQRIRMTSEMEVQALVMSDLSNEAFSYLLGHSHDFFTSNFAGSLTRKVSRYSRSFADVFDISTQTFWSTFIFSIGVVVVLFIRNPFLGMGVLVWTVAFFVAQYFMTRWRYQYKIERAKADTKVTGILSDDVSNHSAITLFAAMPFEKNLFAKAIDEWRVATSRSWHMDATVYGIQGFLLIVIEIGLFAAFILLWQRGILTIGDFVLIQVYILGLVARISNIGSGMRRLYDAFADAEEMIEILHTPHEVADAPGAKSLQITTGEIAFDDVSFAFDPSRPILKNLSFTIPGGEKVALVGPSGAGKSTITKLLLRLYDVVSGTIAIDGQVMHSITLASLRGGIGFVPQEPVLFHRSLRENIAYGKPGVSDEELVSAAQKAHCHEFISALPLGYDTLVGERGVKLSGGERQRVAIARAILKNAPILVLDEATSSLDSESEALIQDALRTLMEGKTVIVIAHRLSTIMSMDRIVVIEDGAIAADGTHDELVNHAGGLYQKLWSIQAGGFLVDTQDPAK